MSFKRVPLVERPLVISDEVERFQNSLDIFGFKVYDDPALALLQVKEVRLTDEAANHRLYESLGQKTLVLAQNPSRTARVTRAYAFTQAAHGGKGQRKFVGLTLQVPEEIQAERRELLEPLAEVGVDITAAPFNEYEYTVLVAHGTRDSRNANQDAVRNLLSRRPTAEVELGQPQPKL